MYVATLPAGYTNVQWYRNGTPVSTANSLTITQAGSYSYTATTSINCPVGSCCPIIVEDAVVPLLTITPVNPTVCRGFGTSLTVDGCGTGTLLWSTGETTATISVTPTSATSSQVYSVTCLSSTYGICTSTASSTVTINENPTLTLSTTAVCAGELVTVTATAGLSSYVFSAGLSPTALPNVATTTVAPLNGTVYSVTAANGFGCTSVASTTAIVNPLPLVSVTPTSQTVCQGTPVPLTANGAATYVWSTGETSPTITVTTSGIYSVTGTSTLGCTNVASATITVNPTPVLTLNAPTICAGQSTTLTLGGCEGGTILWSTGDNTATLVVAPLTTLTYSATCTFPTGCSSTTAATVTVNDAPTFDVPPTATAATCNGQTANANAQIAMTTLQNTVRADLLNASNVVIGTQTVTDSTATFAGLTSPTTRQTYTVRLFSASGCTIDVPVVLEAADCSCPTPKCVPVVIEKVR